MAIRKLKDLELNNKFVLIREDFNVPLENGKITSDARIKAALPTIQYALDHHAKIILISHLGRPEEGQFQPEFSLKPVAESLSKLLKKPVKFIANWIEGSSELKNLNSGEIALCENVRFLKGEKSNDMNLAKQMAKLCDIFVMDAFATAHRAEASTMGVAQYAPIACAGILLSAELEALKAALENPKKPLVAIIGGSKVSTKLSVLTNLINKVDQMIVGGGIANTFLAAQNYPVGKSLYEPDFIEQAKELLKQNKIIMPVDVIVATEISDTAKTQIKTIADIQLNEMILDIGPKTSQLYGDILQKAGTILWNGPVGVFELAPFMQGTKDLSLAIAESPAFSIAGGGDTLAAIEKFAIEDKISYISTGGGAFLEFIEGKTLPAVKILEERGNHE